MQLYTVENTCAESEDYDRLLCIHAYKFTIQTWK